MHRIEPLVFELHSIPPCCAANAQAKNWHSLRKVLDCGISVKTDLLRDGAVSRLYIAHASKADSGNYTCGMRNAHTFITVHILNGEWSMHAYFTSIRLP